MSDHVQRYLSRVRRKNAEATYDKRRSDLKGFTEWLDERGFEDETTLTPLDIEDYFLDQLDAGYAPETIDGRYQSVLGYYRFLTDKLDLYDENPFNGLDRNDFKNGSGSKKFNHDGIIYVTKDEVDQLAEHAPSPTLRNELIIRLLFQTGARRGEILDVDIDEVDRNARSIEIYASKTNDWRTVYYQPSLDVLMDTWIDGGYRDGYVGAETSDSLLVTGRGGLSIHQIGAIITNAAENAGIQETLYTDAAGKEHKRITCHALRHGHAVEALKSGIDVRTVQKHLGHKTLEQTMRYLRLIDDDVRDSYQRFGSRMD